MNAGTTTHRKRGALRTAAYAAIAIIAAPFLIIFVISSALGERRK